MLGLADVAKMVVAELGLAVVVAAPAVDEPCSGALVLAVFVCFKVVERVVASVVVVVGAAVVSGTVVVA